MKTATTILVLLTVGPWLAGLSCNPPNTDELDKLGTIHLTIGGQPFELWIADEFQEQARGLMFVTRERMAPLPDGTERGMLFVFDHERHLSFWMKNVMIPLDIAYADADGIIVAIHTMAPLDDRPGQYLSDAPALYAIEVNANLFETLGVKPGDRVDIPTSVLNRSR